MYRAKLCGLLLNTGCGTTMAGEESRTGSTKTVSAAREGACKLRHSRQGTWAETSSTLVKLCWTGVGWTAQKCAACAYPASSSTLAQPIACALVHHEPGILIERFLT